MICIRASFPIQIVRHYRSDITPQISQDSNLNVVAFPTPSQHLHKNHHTIGPQCKLTYLCNQQLQRTTNHLHHKSPHYNHCATPPLPLLKHRHHRRSPSPSRLTRDGVGRCTIVDTRIGTFWHQLEAQVCAEFHLTSYG